MQLSLSEVAAATGGDILAGDPELTVGGVSVDSRRIEAGALFVALRAERDGHDFAAGAVTAGAAAVLVERPVADLPGGAGMVRVNDTGAALSALGAHARDALADRVPVVGITGSTGKTSAKDLTAAALSAALPVTASPASWNNEIGVPLTLLATTPDTGVVVLEMGARGKGHIAALCAVARPTIGVITNIGLAHAEFFGSRDDVARAKGELLEALPPEGTAVLNADDDTTPDLAARTAARVLTVGGFTHGGDVRFSDLRLDGDLRPSFHIETPWGSAEVGPLAMRGAHQAVNAAFAVAVAGTCGVGPEQAAGALAAAAGSAWRMELTRTPAGLLVVNDAYNANPTSMRAALEALAALGSGRRFAVLGQMAELGDRSDDLHRLIGRQAVSTRLRMLVVVGPGATGIAETARAGGVDVVEVGTPDEALAVISGELEPGDAVLVKASRVVGLERLAEALCELSLGDTPNPGREPPR